MKRYTVIMLVTFDTGIGPYQETHAHKVKAKDAKAVGDFYPENQIIAVIDGWPVVSGVDHQE